jgi:hypothetical protein
MTLLFATFRSGFPGGARGVESRSTSSSGGSKGWPRRWREDHSRRGHPPTRNHFDLPHELTDPGTALGRAVFTETGTGPTRRVDAVFLSDMPGTGCVMATEGR